MFALDCFMMNEDRHTRNFGIVRDVNTLQWIKVAPIYDTGYALQANRNRLNTNFENGTGKFFNNTSKPYEDIFKAISNTTSLYDWNEIEKIVPLYKQQLEKYKDVTNMSSARINALVGGLKHRIMWMNKQIKKLKVTNSFEFVTFFQKHKKIQIIKRNPQNFVKIITFSRI